MTILLISLSAYFLLCLVAAFVIKFSPKKYFYDAFHFSNETDKHPVLVNMIAGILLSLLFVPIFLLLPLSFIFRRKKDDVADEFFKKKCEEEAMKREEEAKKRKEEEERMEIVMGRGCFVVRDHSDDYIPDTCQIIYIESEYDEKLNDFFRRNYAEVRRIFNEEYNEKYIGPVWEDYLYSTISSDKQKGFDFIYLPEFYSKETINDAVQYIVPSNDSNAGNNFNSKEITQKFYSWFLSEYRFFGENKAGITEIKHGLIRYKKTDYCEGNGILVDTFSYYPLEYTTDEEVFASIREYLEFVSRGSRAMYSISTPEHDENFADNEFWGEAQKLADEIRDRVAKLRNMGVNSFLIKQLLIEQPKPSRLRITEDFRIVLPDYNDKEIKMAFLPKVVFFFFLRHQEGLCFKQLCDYKDELFSIYRCVSNRENEAKMTESINSIIDTTNNSINEKCSRIREAFLREFDNEIARNYFVSYIDKSNHIKAIILDRSLVVDESGIMEI